MDDLMQRALAVAAAWRPHPNPRVGAVVVDRSGAVVAEAGHRRAGDPHAEVLALAEAGERAAGGTLVVTLEPCSHHGRTPPCVDAIAAAGIARVVMGVIDPDPRVAGRGADHLRSSGIEVVTGIMPERVEALDPGYFHQRRTGRPLVTLKLAVTVDGQTAASDGSSRWITSPQARHDAHELRAASDAIMVGAGTVLADDPRLDVRLPGYDGPQPQAVVVAGRRPLPADRVIFRRHPLVLSPRPLSVPGEVVVLPGEEGVALDKALVELGERGILDLLVEGGPRLAASILGWVDRLVVYVGACLAGGVGRPAFDAVWSTLSGARPVTITGVRRVGPDVRLDMEVA